MPAVRSTAGVKKFPAGSIESFRNRSILGLKWQSIASKTARCIEHLSGMTLMQTLIEHLSGMTLMMLQGEVEEWTHDVVGRWAKKVLCVGLLLLRRGISTIYFYVRLCDA